MSGTVSRRSAIRTGGLAALVTSLLATTGTTHAQPAPAPTIDQAEALLLDFERILLQLDATERSDLHVELDRLYRIAEAKYPTVVAGELERNTGANRASIVEARAHAYAHNSIIPKYGALIVAGIATTMSPGLKWDEAEVPYAAAKANDIERYGEVGLRAWHIAWSWALFGYCEECEQDGAA